MLPPNTPRHLIRRWLPISLAALVIAIIVATLVLTTTGTPESRLLAATESVGLPPLPPHRAEVYDYYRLGFFEDGYPGRRTKYWGLVPHPIYGPYVISNYLYLFKKTKETRFLEAARRVADAALARMDDQGGMLRFFYEPEWDLGMPGERYVSGLTQSRYLNQLSELHEISGEPRYAEACMRVLRSLATPVEEGGVLASTPHGPVIEEAPHTPRDLVLNGWLTAIRNLRRYLDRTDSEEAKRLLASNLETLASLLPLYDVPDLANSRYRIRGFGAVRLTLGDHRGVHLERPTLDIPGDDVYPLSNEVETRWHMGFKEGVKREGDRFAATSDRIRMNLVLSLLSMPEPNVLRFSVETPRATTLVVELADGQYTPLRSSLRETGWKHFEVVTLEPGANLVEIEFGFDEIDPFIYPTNFAKKIGGRNHNAYHFIHIDGLESLCREYEIEAFCEFAERWQEYVKKWPELPAYRDEDIELYRYKAPVD